MAMTNRAYSVLEIKAINEDQRVIKGIATTPSTDRMGDVVDPAGVKFTNPMPLLWQHNHDEPVGLATFDKPTAKGIAFEAKLPTVNEPGILKDRVDEAWQSVKYGLVRGVSIGFKAAKYSFMDDGGIRFEQSDVYELSLVTVPANQDANIQVIRSIDTQMRAASGIQHPVPPQKPAGVSARPKVTQRMSTKTIGEQIATYEATFTAKSARMDALMDAASERGETLSQDEAEEYDTCKAETKSIEEHLARLREKEKRVVQTAVAVDSAKDNNSASIIRSGVSAVVRAPSLPKGTAFTRYAQALMVAKGNLQGALAVAERWRESTPEVVDILKMASAFGSTDFTRTAVAAGTTTDATWAAPLVNYQVMVDEFIEYLRPMTLLGRIPGFRRVPFNIRVPSQTSGSTGYWVGEGQVKPVSSAAFSTVTLGYTKVAAIVVLTDELVRFSNPSAEGILRQDLAATIAAKLDRDFVDPTAGPGTTTQPASITYNVTPVTATGTTPDALRADIKTLLQSFASNNLSLAGAVWVMTQQQAISIALMRTSQGVPEFPGMTFEGGTLAGIPVVASEAVPATGGSPTDGSMIILMLPNQILLADDGQVTLDASREASLQMDTAPDSPATASTVPISMFQQNMVALRAERVVNWQKARSTSVAFIQNSKYADA